MRTVNENYEAMDESEVDLSVGTLINATIIREDATPIDNVSKFAWYDDDYEDVKVYVLNNEDKIISPQDDTDAMVVDMEYRLTLLELGLSEVN